MAEKTEKATPKKLRDAKKKGQVAKCQDLPAAATFITSIAVTVAIMPTLFQNISQFLTGCFSLITSSDIQHSLANLFETGAYLLDLLIRVGTRIVLINF